jgi:hypothetical protein
MKNNTLLTLVIVVPAVAVLFIAWLRARDSWSVREHKREHDLAELDCECDGEPEWFFPERTPVEPYTGPDRRGRRWGDPVPWDEKADAGGKNTQAPDDIKEAPK